MTSETFRHEKRFDPHSDQPSPIKVCRVITRLNIGGPSHHVTILNHGLRYLGFDTILVVGSEDKHEGTMIGLSKAKELRIVNIPYLTRDVSPLKDLFAMMALYRLFQQEKPKIVHTHLSKAGFVGRVAAKLAGVPIIVHTYHNFVLRGYFGKLKSNLYRLVDRFCASFSDCIVAISNNQRDDLVNFGISDESRIRVIPLGLDLEGFASVSRPDPTFRSRFGIPPQTKLIAAVGRLATIKNLFLLLDAALIARRLIGNLQVVLVGDGALRASLEKYAKDIGLKEVVHFTGWVEDLKPVYAGVDCVVISSDSEGTPVSLIEAMASGCPVVATNVGGVPEFVINGITGRSVPRRDKFALANAIVQVFNDPVATERMSNEARRVVLEKYSEARLLMDINNLYRDLLKQKDDSRQCLRY